jgi:DNA-directed RNA polymerase specialized sigma24 family protein
MKFQVELPDDAFWRLAARAEQYDMKVPDYTAELALAAAAARLPRDRDPVVIAWREGLSDAEIGRRLNMTNSSVAGRRRRYGLPAHRRFTKGSK